MMRLFPLLLAILLTGGPLLAFPQDNGDPPGPSDNLGLFESPDLPTPTERRLASGAPGPAYWQQRADYAIEVELDAEAMRLTGEEKITYHNDSPHTLDYLWVSLDQNVYAPDSLGRRTGHVGNAWRGRDAVDPGMHLTSVKSGGRSLDFTVHDTLARIECAKPIPPGGKLVLSVSWNADVPNSVMRMGVTGGETGKVFALANWFPAIAVYDDVHGWNTLPYLGAGEFYQNFGSYDVSITVPRDHIVTATGQLQNVRQVVSSRQVALLGKALKSADTVMIRTEEEARSGSDRPAGSGPLTWHFKAEDVRTFAWSSSAAYIWDAAGLDGALMQSFYPPEALPLWKDATQMLRSSIAGYSERWFKYPYPTANNVNALGRGGGMEYPMIIFNGRESSEKGLYFLIAHEIGHQWFPMIVNSDERRNPWMDEGFNTFINYYAMIDRFGNAGGQYSPQMFLMMGKMAKESILTPPDRARRSSMGFNAYFKPARLLIMLREYVLGPERFDRAFRDYIRRWAFKQPQPADFFRTMEDAAGSDLSWFCNGWFYGTGNLDQGVKEASVTGNRLRITFSNLGEVVMPVAYTVEFKDGTRESRVLPAEVWTTTNEARATFDLEGRIPTKVIIDEADICPDIERDNNEFTIQSDV